MYHGVAMEGSFWRLTDVAAGRVVIALIGVNRDAAGATWATVALAAHPDGVTRSVVVERAQASGREVWAGETLTAGPGHLRVRLADARLDVAFAAAVDWPLRAFGGIGPAHVVPALSQYWHPCVLGGAVSGGAVLDGREIDLGRATLYAEKNWGRGGFPPAWWWGQAQGFEREDVCVAFAGGRAGLGPVQAVSTALVVRLGDEVLRVVRPLQPMRVDVGSHGWRLRARTARHTIAVDAHAAGMAPHLLPVPLPAERRNIDGAARQHLAGELHLTVRRGRRTLFAGTSVLAGLERGSS